MNLNIIFKNGLAFEDPKNWVHQYSAESDLSERELCVQVSDLLGFVFSEKDITPDFSVVEFLEQKAKFFVLSKTTDNRFILHIGCPDLGRVSPVLHKNKISISEIWLHLPSQILACYQHYEENYKAITSIDSEPLLTAPLEKRENELSISKIDKEESPAIKFLNSTLFDALNVGASDIHLENTPDSLYVRFRLDGVLTEATTLTIKALPEKVIARIKVLANLDISETRIPQDGRFRVWIDGREIDIRVSIIPGVHGEDAVLRILDKHVFINSFSQLSLNQLGFHGETLVKLRKIASEPYGMLLVTGPTGSGKTTTLYALISEANSTDSKFITIEDPVEYQLPGVLQIPVNEKKGLTFSNGLRSVLRHDPDKILVGEIRDAETARIAVQSALTGHLVLSSVHANNAFDVIGRFVHMGVDIHSFVSALTGIVAQRLVRRNCDACTVEYVPVDAELDLLRLYQASPVTVKKGLGCTKCRGTGFRGRIAVAEILYLDDELKEMIYKQRSLIEIKELAYQKGMISIRENAFQFVASGETTIQEVNRVTYVA